MANRSRPLCIGFFVLLASGSCCIAVRAQTTLQSPAATSVPKPDRGQPEAPQNPHHIFFVIPAYRVEYLQHVPPLTPPEKFHEFVEGTYDWRGLGFAAFETGALEHSSSGGFCDYGPGVGGFAKCYGAARLDATVSGFFGDFLFPVWAHQDPRYFRLGPATSGGKRVLYALSRVVITRSDTTREPVFNVSALSGTLLAGGLSNLYYPRSERGVGLTLSRIGIDLLGTFAFDLGAEFWEDISRKLSRDGRSASPQTDPNLRVSHPPVQ